MALWSLYPQERMMLKGVAKAIVVVVVAVIAADEYLYNGFYTDTAMSMLRDMRRSFWW
jgi:hypothetical protein